MSDRLNHQISFIVEIDKLKTVLRQNVPITQPDRQENTAEHSWHIALMALLLAEHADEPIAIERVVSMLLVHDLVEIDAGDTFVYDAVANQDKAEREQKAADRIFNLLPADQATRFRALWEEFEAADTADSRFANAIDHMQPVLLNLATQGLRWRAHGITADRVLERNRMVGDASKGLWSYLKGQIARMVEGGFLPAGPAKG